MALTKTRITCEETLAGVIVNSSLSTTGLSVQVQFRDTKTGAARTPQSTTLLFTIDKDNERFEIIQADSHSTSSGVTTITINASGRALPLYGVGTGSGTGLAHDIGASVGSVILARPINELADQVVAKAGDTMTGALNFSGTTNSGLQVNSLTTAQRDALASPANGMIVYNTTTGEFNIYQGGAWSAMSSGSTQPNASESVAGKVEAATVAEQIAHSSTGGTGALLFPQVGNMVTTSAGAADSGKVGILQTDGRWDNTLHNQTLVGGVTTEASTLHYHEGARFLVPAGEAVDGSTTPQLVFISDGTNGKTAGSFYKADADNTTDVALNPVGFINQNASSIGTSYLVKTGIVGGFTGLTAGALYYSSTTAGSITATASVATEQRPVGRAISTTQLLAFPAMPHKAANAFGNATAINQGATSVITKVTGFKAKFVTFNLFLEAGDSAGAGYQRHAYGGSYDGSTWSGTQVLETPQVTSFSSAPTAVASGGGANKSSITLSITFNANSTVFTLTNAITAGSGSSNTGYRLSATIHPY